MTNNRILEIIQEEIIYENNLILESSIVGSSRGFRNNQLLIIEGEETAWEKYAPEIAAKLDWVGLLPGIGEFFNAISGIIKFSVKDVVGGAISFIGAIPFVGKFLGAPFKLIHKFVSKYLKAIPKKGIKDGLTRLREVFIKLKDGNVTKAAADLLGIIGELAKKAGGSIKSTIEKMYKFISSSASKINGGIDKVIPSIEEAIKTATFGVASGLPGPFKKVLQTLFNQMKEFFTGLGKGKLYQTTKNVTKKKSKELLTSKEVSKKDKEIYGPAYNKADKKKYPNFAEFVKSAKEWNARKANIT